METTNDDHEIGGELSCYVYAVEKFDESSVSCGMFLIHVYANFMPPINESEEDECSYLDCEIVEKTFLVEREKLFCQETSTETITEILDSMNVPVNSFIINKILDCARLQTTGSSDDKGGYCLKVQIYVLPRSSSRFQEEAMDMDNVDIIDDDHEFESRLGPATKASIEALENIRVVDDSRNNCAICLDEVSTGSEATRMPCLHVFHSTCILNWLDMRGTCPLCRNQIS